MDSAQFAEFVGRGREQPSVEFKGAGPRTSKPLFAKVVRAVLGMANRRDGGFVIIGVDESAAGLELTGLSAEDLKTWSYDAVADGISRYAEPSVEFDVLRINSEERVFVVVRVEEFDEVPVLCKKDFNVGNELVLREGACYIRPRRKPETVQVSTYADMRDLLDLATDKSLRRFVARAYAAGVPVSMRTVHSDADQFEQQLEEFQ